VKDGRDAKAHLDRARLFEKEMGLPDFQSPKRGKLRGHGLMVTAVVLLTVFNVLVIADQVVRIVFAPHGT
jgi:hypothetical protein